MGDWGNKLSSGVHIKLLHWERILMMTNHAKKPACGWWLGTVHLICPQHKEVKLITVPTCIVQLCKAVFQARSLLGPDQGKSSLLYLTIPTLQCQYKAKESAIHRREDNLQNCAIHRREDSLQNWVEREKSPVREKVDSPDIAILATSDDDIVCDWHKTVDCVRVPGELVTVQTILAPVQNKAY